MPVRVEHEYQRKGALSLFAAFDTRTGKAYAHTAERKRQKEFIEFLAKLDREIPEHFTKIHLVMDNVRMHTGKQARAWLEQNPRFKFHHPPVHCSLRAFRLMASEPTATGRSLNKDRVVPYALE
jgi:hypothetical protein